MRNLILSVIALMAAPPATFGKEVQVAVASNFRAPMEKISQAFQESTGDRLLISFGGTGKLYSQIRNGAPFEVLLSADQERPRQLIQEQLAVADSRFTYAIGRLVLWSPKLQWTDENGDILKSEKFKHLAIANPSLAPYGVAAQEVLEKLRCWKTLQSRIVTGEDITQAFQFVATGNAELGLVALSQIKANSRNAGGSVWRIPENWYSPLRQDAVLLLKGKDNEAAKRLLKFLKDPQIQDKISEYGYGTEIQ